MTKSPQPKKSLPSAYKTVGKTYDGVKVLAPKATSKSFSAADVRRAIKKALAEISDGSAGRPLRESDAMRVEKRDDGRFEVRRQGAKRVSAIKKTQEEAIAKARELNPGKAPIVKRVRKQAGSKKGTWRQA